MTLFDSITNFYQLYVNYPWKKDAYTVEKLPVETTNERVTSKENIKTKNKKLTMMKLEVFIYYKLYYNM